MTISDTVAATMTWPEFRATAEQHNLLLLRRLDEFPRSVLVTGCQRSGTTMLARLITTSSGMTNYWFGHDDELDAALILSGQVDHRPEGRYCFQTTYLNGHYREYYEQSSSHQLIWMLRKPESVVYSMLHNWSDWALDDLFRACGVSALKGVDRWRYRTFGPQRLSRLRRACWSYVGKVSQLFELREVLGARRIKVVDYDELVTSKAQILPEIYRFIDLDYSPVYAQQIRNTSLTKHRHLNVRQRATIFSICRAVYRRARRFAGNKVSPNGA